MLRIFHNWLAIYPVVFGDYLIAWRNSLFVALILTFWYGAALIFGIYLALTLYDILGPTIELMTLTLPILASIAIDLIALALLVILAVALCLYLARTLLYGLTTLFEDSDIDEVFYTALAVALVLVVIAFALALLNNPPLGESAVTIGFLLLIAISLLVITSWLHLRYRIKTLHRHWTGSARVYRHDLGAALVRLEQLC